MYRFCYTELVGIKSAKRHVNYTKSMKITDAFNCAYDRMFSKKCDIKKLPTGYGGQQNSDMDGADSILKTKRIDFYADRVP